ncbi:MAG: hypothetical protein BWY11_01671 [Firmicutes bacterium ADurb.Bin182]|nr:MAG: hypothetical protein BWY11_01671 [Firmicutes bacterium ADurb.Bin182]
MLLFTYRIADGGYAQPNLCLMYKRGVFLIRFYLPYTYWFYTRCKSGRKITEFLALYIVPSGIICLSKENAGSFFVALIAIACVFEAGFIQNDIVSPSRYRCVFIRSNADFYRSIKKHIRSMIAWRYALAALMISILYLSQRINTQKFLVVLLLSSGLFSVHSGMRGRWRLMTGGALYTLQCAALPVLFLNDPFHATFAFILAYVVRKIAENASQPEFGLTYVSELFGNPASFYIPYYCALKIAAFILLAFWRRLASVLLTIGSWYLLFTLVNFVFSITEKKTDRGW